MKKILITGISGFIGNYLHKYRPRNIQVTGTYFDNKSELNGIDLVLLDLAKVDEFMKLVNAKMELVNIDTNKAWRNT